MHFYIGGKWLQPAAGGMIDVIDWATEEVMGRIRERRAADAEAAVEAAMPI